LTINATSHKIIEDKENKEKGVIMTIDNIKHWCSGGGEIELAIDEHLIDSQPTQGDCLSSVQHALDVQINNQLELVNQLEAYTEEVIIATAIEYGCDNYGCDKEPTKQEAMEFIVWMAIGDLQEEQFEQNGE